jgi:hypothetical protein
MKETLIDIRESARNVARRGRVLILFVVTYVALLATAGIFITTREATIKDVLITLTLLIVTPALFFLLQAMCITLSETENARDLIKRSVSIVRKVAIISLPFIVIGIALFVILGRIENHFSPTFRGQTIASLSREGEPWVTVLFSTLRLVLFGIVIPLACIHAWLAVVRQPVRNVLSSIKTVVTTAFGLPSIKTYVVGFVLFGLIPYVLIAVRTPSDRAWLEISMLSLRLVLALGLMLVGWVITVVALQRGLSTES